MTGVILMSTKKENGNFCSSDDSDKKPKLPKLVYIFIKIKGEITKACKDESGYFIFRPYFRKKDGSIEFAKNHGKRVFKIYVDDYELIA